MAKQGFSDLMHQCEVMVSGIKRNREKLTASGIDQARIDEFDSLYNGSKEKNNEQEKMKADLKAKTADLSNDIKNLRKLFANMKKRIKLEVEKERWKEYGIEDKQ